MPNYFCCVAGCNAAVQKRKRLEKYPWMEDVTFHPFPKLVNTRRQWINMVRREPSWNPGRFDTVCSMHFAGGAGPTSRNPIPTIFPWTAKEDSKRSTKAALKATVREDISSPPGDVAESENSCSSKIRIAYMDIPYVAGESEVSSETPLIPQTSENGVHVITPSSDEHAYGQRALPQKTYCDVGLQTDMTADDILYMEEQVIGLKESGLTVNEAQLLLNENKSLKAKLEDTETLQRENFMKKVVSSDRTVKTYTGVPNVKYLFGVFNILDKSESKIKYWSGKNSAAEKQYHDKAETKKPGPKRKLTRFEEFVLTMVGLRLGLSTLVTGHLFGISKSRVSQIFTTWITYMSCVLGPLVTWPTRAQVRRYMPLSFKSRFPSTRVIIDCTEFFFQRPRGPHAQSTTYSTYKSHNTGKLLVGVTPAGTICFLSDLYGGNASDRFITEHSGFLDLIEPGDDVMADRGFTIRDLLTVRRATLNIPPFTRKCRWGKGKFLTVQEISKGRTIAKIRIHVERAIGRMKNFRFLASNIPWVMKDKMNQIIRVVAFFCNMDQKLVRK